tara:strand:+ start:164 stop:823 length:660 start_codon:yes stop_codon:yes gene_type:complete
MIIDYYNQVKIFIRKILTLILYYLFKKITYKDHSLINERFEGYNFEKLDEYENIYCYSTISAIINFQKNKQSILDVGCGTAPLLRTIDNNKILKYKGIDFSKLAIKKARKIENKNISFECTDMLKFNDKDKYDIIVFSESIYYLRDNNQIEILIEKYDNFLKQNGLIIISGYFKVDHRIIFEKFDRRYVLVDNIYLSRNNNKMQWFFRIYRKSNPQNIK